MDEMDLRERFDAAFGSEPPLPRVDDRLDAGRRALLRRRVVTGCAAAALASIALVGVTQLGGATRTQQDPAGPPDPETPAQVEQRLTDAAPVDVTWKEHCGHPDQPTCSTYAQEAAPVGIDAAGDLRRLDDAVVIARRVDHPAPSGGGTMVVVELRTPESIHSQWWVVTRDGTRLTARTADPSRSAVDFETWAAAITSGRQVAGAPPLARARAILGR